MSVISWLTLWITSWIVSDYGWLLLCVNENIRLQEFGIWMEVKGAHASQGVLKVEQMSSLPDLIFEFKTNGSWNFESWWILDWKVQRNLVKVGKYLKLSMDCIIFLLSMAAETWEWSLAVRLCVYWLVQTVESCSVCRWLVETRGWFLTVQFCIYRYRSVFISDWWRLQEGC